MKTKRNITCKLNLFGKTLAATLLFAASSVLATTFYVSPTGSDSNNGSPSHPLVTVAHALTLATASGDVIELDSGTYNVPDTIAGYEDGNVYAVVNLLTSANNGITIESNPTNTTRPALNFSAINPSGYRIAAFWIPSGVSGVTFKGFDVVGVKENITGSNNQSLGFGIYGGSSCTWNQVNVHDGECAGFYLEDASANNTFYQCDAYNLTGINSYSYGNADGFGCHPAVGGTGNVYNQCRSWNNSDDGFDCLNACEPITFEYCWSYMNGNNGGNGNGFKIGGFGCSGGSMPGTIPVHTVKYCLAADNPGDGGFYANHQPGQAANWTYNTSFNNKADFNMLEGTGDSSSDCSVSGTKEVMHYNLYYEYSYEGIYNLNESGSIVSNNTWTEGITPTISDFESTDASQITEARQSNGDLPNITFMHPVSGSPTTGYGCF
jgi:hypothetical protein